MKAYIFPGQGSQFPGMGKDLYEHHQKAKDFFLLANEILGFEISKIMFEGSDEELKQTRVTQPAVFLHSVIQAEVMEGFHPEMVAGHSLGEFSALVANHVLSFQDGLKLVSLRAQAMQKACEITPSTMAAVLGLEDQQVEEICDSIEEMVVPANYNSPGQLVISGSLEGIAIAEEKLKAAGAKRVVVLNVGGAFHSPLMKPAEEELARAIKTTRFAESICPVYQNDTGYAVSDPEEIKENLIKQLTSPVKWTQSIQAMIRDGATSFTEVGPGKILQSLVRKIDRTAEVHPV